MNLVIYNGVEGLPKTDQITTLRKLLSIEHECIDYPLSDYNPYKLEIKKSSSSQDQSEDQAEDKPTLTWVEHWNKIAAENLEAIKIIKNPYRVFHQDCLNGHRKNVAAIFAGIRGW